jgi:hypothetical protein
MDHRRFLDWGSWQRPRGVADEMVTRGTYCRKSCVRQNVHKLQNGRFTDAALCSIYPGLRYDCAQLASINSHSQHRNQDGQVPGRIGLAGLRGRARREVGRADKAGIGLAIHATGTWRALGISARQAPSSCSGCCAMRSLLTFVCAPVVALAGRAVHARARAGALLPRVSRPSGRWRHHLPVRGRGGKRGDAALFA